jgi:hypothetical protein
MSSAVYSPACFFGLFSAIMILVLLTTGLQKNGTVVAFCGLVFFVVDELAKLNIGDAF